MTQDYRREKNDDRPRNRDDRGPRKFDKGRGRPYDKKGFKPRDGKRPYRPKEETNGEKEFHPREDGEKREYRPRDRDDGKREYRPRNNGGDRYGHRDGNRGRPRYNDRRDDRRGDRPDRYDRRERSDRPERNEEPHQEQKLTIPSTPQRILFKGVDCEINGRTDLAMVLYLHGAALMSKGCENNALEMLKEMGPGEFKTVRGRVSKMCSDDAMIEYDYLCWTIDNEYNRSLVDSAAADGNPFAIYCRIRLDEIEGDDECIDRFVEAMESNPEMVEDGLKLLKRRKDSVKAEDYLKKNEERKKLRQSIRSTFVKAKKGDRGSMKRLEELAEMFPEADFLVGFLNASASGDAEGYLKKGYAANTDIILSMEPELGVQDTVFGMFIRAKRLQKNEEEWIPLMINAAKAGSDAAMEELRPVQNRKDVRKSFCSIYLANGDVENLVKGYDGEDTYWLDQYCQGDLDRIVEIGKTMGGVREIDWLKRNYRNEVEGCRDVLIDMASDESRQCKQLVYALHDVGADVSAAKLYFDMYGDPTLPSIKWLGKVCEDEAAKEYIRSQFESMGDLKTFDSIFVDDGYVKGKPRGGGNGRSGGFNKGKGGKRRY